MLLVIGVGRTSCFWSLPPPNRACGSPAHGSPVSGSPQRGLTGQRMGCDKRKQPMCGKENIGPALIIRLNHLPPFTPFSSAVNMRSVQTDGSTQDQRSRISPTCLALSGTAVGCRSIVQPLTHPLPCAPFAPCPLRHFIATMGALTPAPPGPSATRGRLNTGLFATQVSPLHVHALCDHSVSNHLATPCHRFITLPISVTGFPCGSGLRHSLAGSSESPGRIEFVILRTGHSPPVALHPASRRRSYGRLQTGERMPGRDSHPSVHVRLRAH